MSVRRVQQGFTGGEVSPAMYGRFDDAKYQQGLAMCRNFMVLPQGPVVNRPGFEFVREVKYSDKPTVLLPFVYSNDQTMCLEFGDKYIRFHTGGATLLGADGEPYEVETPYSAEQLAKLHFAQSADILTLAHPSYAPRELRRYGPSDWRLVVIEFDPPVAAPTISEVTYSCGDSSASGKDRYTLSYAVTAVSDKDGVEVESKASATQSVKGNLYINNSYSTIKWGAVSGAQRYRVYKSYKGLLGYIGETSDLSFIDDNYEADEGITPPLYDESFKREKGIESVTVNNTGSGYYGMRNIMGYMNTGFRCTETGEPHPSGEKVSFPFRPSDSFAAVGNPVITVVDTVGQGGGAVVEVVSSTFETIPLRDKFTGFKIVEGGRDYVAPEIRMSFPESGVLGQEPICYSFPAKVNNEADVDIVVSDSTGTGAVLEPEISDGKITGVMIVSGGMGYSNPTISVVAERGSGASLTPSVGTVGDYPSAVTYYEQRRCFAGTYTRPQMIWMTRSGTESDMSYTLPSKDDNRIKFRIAALEASRVLHLVPISQLVALTESTEFRVTSVNSDALTPTSISVKPQAYVGSSEVQPIIVNSSMVYVASRGGHVREMGYNWQASGFVTGDLSLRAAHLFEDDRVVDMAQAKAPVPTVWCVMDNGSLLGLTYLPDQNVGAWHRHDTKNGKFESVAVVPEGEEDALYAVVKREINGKTVRYIERLHERYFEELTEAFYVDCGATYRGAETETISGLTWLEGQEVAILANGKVLPNQVVTNGKITLSEPATVVHVGLPIEADLQTLPTVISLQDGSYGMGHMKNINEVWARVYKTSGFFAGPSFDELSEYKQRTTENYGSPPELMDKEIALTLFARWSDTGVVCIRQPYPLPMTLVNLTYEIAS